MVYRGKDLALPFIKDSVVARDPEIRGYDAERRDPAETDDKLRINDPRLLAQIFKTRRLLLRQRIAVFRRTAFYRIAYVYLFAAQSDRDKILVEKLTGATDERSSGLILGLSRRLSYEHYNCVDRALAENDVVSRFTKSADAAFFDFFLQL